MLSKEKIKSQLNSIQHITWLNENEAEIVLGKEARYDFKIYLDLDYDCYFQIAAKLRHESKKYYFWYGTFIFLPDSVKSQQQALEGFIECCRIAATRQTRIQQIRGWLFYNFHLEYLEGDTWKVAPGGTSCFRFSNFVVPNKFCKTFFYYGY